MKEDFYTLEKNQLLAGIVHCLSKAKQLLADVTRLLGTVTSLSSALGLYTFALEEYGKALWLYDCIKESQEKYKIPKEIFSNHNKKIKRALNELPEEFSKFYPGARLIIPSTEDETKIVGPNNEKIIRTSATTGVFWNTDKKYVTDFDVRKDCFYVGWDDKKRRWKYEIGIVDEDLEKFISKLEQNIRSFEKTHLGNLTRLEYKFK